MKINIYFMDEENMPYRQSMRKSSGLRKGNGYDSWEDYYPRRQYKTYVSRFIEKNIGKNYNEVFSKFLSKLKDMHMSERDIAYMREDFNYAFTSKYWWRGDYEVDENGNIVKASRKSKSRDVIIYTEELCMAYRLKEKYRTYADRLVQLIGYDEFDKICNEYVTWNVIELHKNAYELFIKYIKENSNLLKHIYNPTITIMELFDTKNITDHIVIEYGTPEYYQYMAELKDMENKERREFWKKKKAILETNLYDIESKRKMIAKEENDVKIIKNGFDPKTSFRKVPAKN